MGKGTIATNTGDGLYTVDLDFGSAIKAQRLATANARKVVLEADIVAAEANLVNKNFDLNTLLNDLDSAIVVYNNDGDSEKLNDATVAAQLQRNDVRDVESGLTILRLNLANIKSEIKTLTALDVLETKAMWCADYTADASGEVATIEVDGEQPVFLIYPGAPAPLPIDGVMIDRGVQTGPQLYFNSAILPGWQKYLPTYRSGGITEINRGNHTCNVVLDPATLSAQNLDINQAPVLRGIPIEYMTCNSSAFSVADLVIVEFVNQDQDDPRVIGFVSNPKVCGPARIFFMFEEHTRTETQADSTPIYYAVDPSEATANPDNGHTIVTEDRTGTRSTAQAKVWGDTRSVEQATIRIRFDVSWVELTSDALEFTIPEAGLEPVLTEVDGVPVVNQYYEIDVDAAVDVTVDPEQVITQSWGTVSGEHCVYILATNNWVCSSDTLVGGTTVFDTYKYPSIPYIPGFIDTQSVSDWLEAVYDPPPNEIIIEIDGGPVEYVFETIGVGPECQDQDITVPVANPKTGAGLNPEIDFTYDLKGEEAQGIIYRRKDLPAP